MQQTHWVPQGPASNQHTRTHSQPTHPLALITSHPHCRCAAHRAQQEVLPLLLLMSTRLAVPSHP